MHLRPMEHTIAGELAEPTLHGLAAYDLSGETAIANELGFLGKTKKTKAPQAPPITPQEVDKMPSKTFIVAAGVLVVGMLGYAIYRAVAAEIGKPSSKKKLPIPSYAAGRRM